MLFHPLNNFHYSQNVPQTEIKQVRQENTYFWCDEATGGHCGSKWRVHKPSECMPASEFRKKIESGEIKPHRFRKRERQEQNNDDTTKTAIKREKKLKIAKALTAIGSSDSEDSA